MEGRPSTDELAPAPKAELPRTLLPGLLVYGTDYVLGWRRGLLAEYEERTLGQGRAAVVAGTYFVRRVLADEWDVALSSQVLRRG